VYSFLSEFQSLRACFGGSVPASFIYIQTNPFLVEAMPYSNPIDVAVSIGTLVVAHLFLSDTNVMSSLIGFALIQVTVRIARILLSHADIFASIVGVAIDVTLMIAQLSLSHALPNVNAILTAECVFALVVADLSSGETDPCPSRVLVAGSSASIILSASSITSITWAYSLHILSTISS